MSIKEFEKSYREQNVCSAGESADILLEDEDYDVDPEIAEIIEQEQQKL